MAIILDGAKRATEIKKEVRREASKLAFRPGLAVIQVGDDLASQIYVRNKKRDCEECGINCEDCHLSDTASEADIIGLIKDFNAQSDISGILVQLPLPHGLDQWRILQEIGVVKDVDGFTAENISRLAVGVPAILPCTPAGILDLLQEYSIPIEGSNCVIVGRSNIVGKPLARILLAHGATVTVCHSKTIHLEEYTRKADILISATGVSGLIKANMLNNCMAVIDVGITRSGNGKLHGDVCFEEVSRKASFITPVPGGVGPMTRAMLMRNVLQVAQLQQRGV